MIRILMGINIIKNGIFPFFLDCSFTCILVILAAAAFVNSPGELFLAEFCHSSQLSTQGNPGAPGASQLSPEVHQKMADFREFGSLRTLTRAPVVPAPVLKYIKKWRTSGSLGV